MRLPIAPGSVLLVLGAACRPIEAPPPCEPEPGADIPLCVLQDGARTLRLEVLDDDLLHYEWSDGTTEGAIPTTMMVAASTFPGPTDLEFGSDRWRTASLEIVFDAGPCFSVARTGDGPFARFCDDRAGGLEVSGATATDVYGLGQRFRDAAEFGDRLGTMVTPGSPRGNALTDYDGGKVGATQIPFLLAVEADGRSWGTFVDVAQAQTWDLAAEPWTMRSAAAITAGFLLEGPDPIDVRADYLALTGRPPVPPRRAFGLWLSEYGYDSWDEATDKLETLAASGFPVDVVVLDLPWFGGIPDRMGSLTWDETAFPDPVGTVAALDADHGVRVVTIEEPYVVASLPEHADLASRGYLVRACEGCDPVALGAWWGDGGMIDWTNPEASAYWHDAKREPLVDDGVLAHWTDLGEPEQYAATAWYDGDGTGAHGHDAWHNLYNLGWTRGIAEGYARNGRDERPFVLTRSGTAGTQRYGAALWSGDIASTFPSLAAHLDAQTHVAISGIDYYGSDLGGFKRGDLSGEDLDALYTAWFAAGALLDVPVRPHVSNVDNLHETAPDRVGDVESNLHHLRLRYALTPYFTSLAHRAWEAGEPVVAPPVLRFPTDPAVRDLWSEKVVGPFLWVAAITEPDATALAVHLPAGRWLDLHGGTWVDSDGVVEDWPVRPGGAFRLPVFARSGAILPRMPVDEQTMNVLGQRRDGSTRLELDVLVVAGAEPTTFPLIEDDGATIAYQSGAVRRTELSQRIEADAVVVTIGAAQGTYDGAPAERPVVVHAWVDGTVTGVTVGDRAVPPVDPSDLGAAVEGWATVAGEVVVKLAAAPVGVEQVIRLVR